MYVHPENHVNLKLMWMLSQLECEWFGLVTTSSKLRICVVVEEHVAEQRTHPNKEDARLTLQEHCKGFSRWYPDYHALPDIFSAASQGREALPNPTANENEFWKIQNSSTLG